MFAAVRLSLSFLTKRERIKYFLLVALRSLAGLLDVAGIALIGLLAGVAASQFGTSGGAPLTFLGFTFPVFDEQSLIVLVLIVLAVFAVKALIAILLSKALTSFIASIETRNATKIANLLFRGSLADIKKFSKAEVQWAVTGSTTYAFTGLLNGVATLVTEGLLLILVCATFFVVDPIATIFVGLYFAGIIVIIQFVIGKSLKKAGQDSSEGNIGTNGAINDTLDAFREISVLGVQDLFVERIRASRSRLSNSGGVMAFLGGMPRYVVETALMLGVVLFVGQQFLSGQLDTGIVVVGVFLTGGVRIMASLLPLQNAVAQMKNHVEQSALAHELLSKVRVQEIAAAAKTQPAPRAEDITFDANGGLSVDIHGIDFHYPGDDHDTLRNISLRIEGGQQVAFIGPSGAGKTTLVDLVLGLIAPDNGSVSIGGLLPSEVRAAEPGLIAYVPQKPGLVSGTIAQNVALGVTPESIDIARVETALAAAHLTDFIATLPDGVHTVVGKQADALSGGQVQRIGLARALYVRPRLIILDEATSALDAGSEAFVSASLKSLGEGVTVIIIAHRLSTVQHSDVVFVLEGGTVTASGKFNELRRSVPMVAEYVKLMSFDDK